MTDPKMPHDGEKVNLPIACVEGEPRILDTDLAKRLGFSNPIDIRKLVRRHEASLAEFGTVATVARVKRGQEATEYHLSRKQAIFITAKSETAAATEITIEIIERFDAYEKGLTPPKVARALPPAMSARQMYAVSKLINTVMSVLPNLGENSRQSFISTATEAALGRALVPQPVLTQASYTTTEIAEEAGISAQRAGAISNRHGLKVPANGENRMSKSQYSSKQVEQFHWNPTGKAALLAAIAAEFVPSRGNGAEPTVQQEGRA